MQYVQAYLGLCGIEDAVKVHLHDRRYYSRCSVKMSNDEIDEDIRGQGSAYWDPAVTVLAYREVRWWMIGTIRHIRPGVEVKTEWHRS